MPRSLAPACLAATALLCTGCLFHKNVHEELSPTIQGTSFRSIATVAGASMRTALRLAAQVREDLNKGGWHAVPHSGRWDTERGAVRDICAAKDADHVDGVLFVSYDELTLYDCATGEKAYYIQGSPEAGGLSIRQTTARLKRYLRGRTGTPLSAHGS